MISSSYSFKTTTFGKWILAGEHAVLRGHAAIVFPLLSKQLDLTFVENSHSWSVEVDDHKYSFLEPLLLRLLAYAQEKIFPLSSLPLGAFYIHNTIPIGSGMGASAALCVAISRWLVDYELIEIADLFNVAKNLENLFHGQSSGLDVIGVASQLPQYFQQGHTQTLSPSWEPCFCLTNSGSQGLTSPCISKVQELWKKNPEYAKEIDEQMQTSVLLAHKALLSHDPKRLDWLVESINLACACFASWGLITASTNQRMQQLKNKGALAVKPTGSGGGGYLLSLWDAPHQPVQIDSECIWVDI